MAIAKAIDADHGAALVIPPDGGENHWQPVPANGHISVRIAPHLIELDHDFSLGTQTLPPRGYVREHAHPHHDEVLHFISGTGKAVLDGVEHKVTPGTTIFVGKNRRHMFINNSDGELHWLWFVAPHGLETFFAGIGQPKEPGAEAPAPFPRRGDILDFELATAFSDQAEYGGREPDFD